jgi:hypothetical protein
MEDKIPIEDVYGLWIPPIWEVSTATPPTGEEVLASREAYRNLQKHERWTIEEATRKRIRFLPRFLRLLVYKIQERRYRNHWAWKKLSV